MTISKYGNGKATGKIILMGEHSVVYGKPAIAIPFHKANIEVKVTSAAGPISVECLYHHGEICEVPKELTGLKKLIETTLQGLGKPCYGLHFEIISSLPAQRGLGSSAAVSVALIRAIYDYFDLALDEHSCTDLSLVSERVNHGNPSGLDSKTISMEKAIYFTKGKQERCIPILMDAVLVVADSGRQGNTAEAILEVSSLLKNEPLKMEGIMNRLGELTDEVSLLLSENKVELLGKSLNEAHLCLRLLGVSDDGIEQLIQAALNHGAVGAKITGSGKGGCIIALCQNEADAFAVSEALLQAGAIHTWFYDLKEIAEDESDSTRIYQHSAH